MKKTEFMKGFSSVLLICALFLFPCILNLEKVGCILFEMALIPIAFVLFKKYNPEFVL
jgi:hypothetical protein